MGQKVSPVGLRVGINRAWDSSWYADKDYSKYLVQDINVRNYIEKECKDAKVSRTFIERANDEVKVTTYVVNSGLIIGQDATRTNKIVKELTKICGGKKVSFTAANVENPDLDAVIVAKNMALQLENRASFRVVQKQAIKAVMAAGAKGIKTSISGRLGGADIARAEGYSEGVVSLHTLRQDIDYASVSAATTYGRLGVKVWISKGTILAKKADANQAKGE